jgi:hypothetical protein
MAIILMQLTPGLAAVQIPLSLFQDLGAPSERRATQEGAASNISTDTLPVSGPDQTVDYRWEGRELDIPLIDGGIASNNAPSCFLGRGLQASLSAGSPAWKDSASWGCSAVRGAFLQPATWVA